MKTIHSAIHACLFGVLAVLAFNAQTLASQEAPNFVLLDPAGKAHELHRLDGRAVVLFFTGLGCPIARKTVPKLKEIKERFGDDVTVWIIYADARDDRESVRKESAELAVGSIPVLLDANQALSVALGVSRTGEAVALDATDWTIFYRGAVDDQLAEGAEKPEPTNAYLQTALTAHLANEAIATRRTATRGCLISFESGATESDDRVSYSRQVAPILESKCAGCHRDGDIGPFSFSNYSVVKRKARMIEEVLLTQRMPPWSADPHFGKFANDKALSAAEQQILLRWIGEGAPRDDGADPLAETEPLKDGWTLGPPDYVVKLPHPEEIPATGVLNYRHIMVDSPVPEDAWLAATVIKPGNRKVVHHCIVYAKFEGSGNDFGGVGVKIAGWAPGRLPCRLPEGTGIFLGKGAKLDIELHYTTNGAPQTDDTEIGLYLHHERPKLAYKTGMAIKLDFKIPPNAPEAISSATFRFSHDSILFTLTPHMHVRGSWMNYEAVFPDGRRETLLAVPRYDFNWQTTYRLAQPLRVPAGTQIVCTGAFDNSVKNPSNPDPGKEVRWGEQSWNEMFIGYVGYAELPSETAAN